MHRTLAHGRLTGFASGLGAAVADALFGAIAAFGLTAVTAFLIDQQLMMRLAGGAFLLGLGAKIFLSAPNDPAAQVIDRGLARSLATTFLLTITNPLTILSFVAIFAGAGLARPEGDYRGASLLVLDVFLGSALWWLSLSTVIGLLRHKLERGGLVWINRGSGALIFAFGVAAWASLAAGL